MANTMTLDAYAAHDAQPGLFNRLRTALADRSDYRRTYAELSALTDRELRDIGLSRPDVAAAARGAVYRR